MAYIGRASGRAALVTADIPTDSINSDHYVDASIDTAHIGANQVTAAKMAANSVDSDQYVDGSIDNAHLADDAVGIAELSATGTADATTFLRGDNAWTASWQGEISWNVGCTGIGVETATNKKLTYDIVSGGGGGGATVHFVQGFTWDTTNKRFVVPSGQAGRYLIGATFMFTDVIASGTRCSIRLYTNGTEPAYYIQGRWTVPTVNTPSAMSCAGILDLTVGEYAEIFAYQNSGSTVDSAGGYNSFWGVKLG